MKSILAIAVGIALCAGLWGAQDSRSPEVQLKAAIHKEEVLGDLKGAIDQYKKLANSSNRVVAANALIRMGQCYEKLGDAEARKAYERILSAFQDQKDTVALARVRLAALEGAAPRAAASSTSEFRLRRIGSGKWMGSGEVSPDGRYQALSDADDDLAIHDLVTGTERKLTDKIRTTGDDILYSQGCWSPDGKSIAFAWENGKTRNHELHVIKVDSKADRILPLSGILEEVYQWLQDGKSLLIGIEHPPITRETPTTLALLDISTGKQNELLTLNAGQRVVGSRMSPNSVFAAFEVKGDIYSYSLMSKQQIPLVVHPASDHLLDWTPDGGAILFKSDRFGKPAILGQRVVDGKPFGDAILVKPDAGDVRPLGFSSDGSYFWALPEFSSNNIYSFRLDAQVGTESIQPKNISLKYEGSNGNPEISRDGKSIAYVADTERSARTSQGNLISIYNLESNSTEEFPLQYEILIPSDRIQWVDNNQAILFWGRRSGVKSLLRLNVKSGAVEVQIERTSVNGFLRGASADGSVLFLDRIIRVQTLRHEIVSMDLKSQKETLLFGIDSTTGTISTAGVFLSPDGKTLIVPGYIHPKNGEPVGSAKFWLVPSAGGEPRELSVKLEPKAVNTLVCGWSADSRNIFLTQYSTYAATSPRILKVPIDGSPVTAINLQKEGFITNVSLLRDGKTYIFSESISRDPEVWVMENFLPILKAK